MKIIELKKRRETYGGDERSINRHSIRVYQSKRPGRGKEPIEFYLNRTLDGCPTFYCLYFYKPFSSLPTFLNVDGEQYWGKGLSWAKAEGKAMNRMRELLEA